MFDYVIVGAGSAGCVLAERLSAQPGTRVCLLEAGPPDTHPLIHMPFGIAWLMWSKRLNWQYYTAPQRNLDGRRLFWPRGKTLGGSSSTNAMCYTRGHPGDYDDWVRMGNPGWGYADLLPYFRRSENRERGETAYHGVNGPLNVAPQRSPNPLSLAFVEAGVQAGYPRNDDFNGVSQEGVGLYEVTQKDGRRWSAAQAYLRPAMGRPNLTVISGARATRVLLSGKRAVGVAYVRGGAEERAEAGEVILAGGAINSPHLLLLSGVGPRAELQPHGIDLLHELPGVGRNLQDHLDVLVVSKCRKPISYGLSPRSFLRSGGELLDYFRRGRGMFTSNAAEGGGFVRSSSDEARPDLQFHFTPVRLDEHGRNLATFIGHGYALHACDLRPRSRGYIGLASADPLADPLIDPNYLDDPADLDKLVTAARVARRVLSQAAFDEFRGDEIFPGESVSSDDEGALRAFVRRKAGTIYHPVGTCAMGVDDQAVVDNELRVHGLEGLRVVDASVMPKLIGGNTNGPVIALAERAADLVLGREPLAPAAEPDSTTVTA